MNLYDQIFKALQGRNTNELKHMEKACGISWITLYHIQRGNNPNPRWNTLLALQKLLRIPNPDKPPHYRRFRSDYPPDADSDTKIKGMLKGVRSRKELALERYERTRARKVRS